MEGDKTSVHDAEPRGAVTEQADLGSLEDIPKDRPLRVLFIIDHLDVGGVQEFILNYVRQMNHHVTVAAIFRGEFYVDRLKSAGAEVIQITDSSYGHAAVLDPRNLLAFRRFARSRLRAYNVIHIRLFAAFFYASLLRLYKYDNIYPSIDATPKQIPRYIMAIYRVYARKYRWFFLPPIYVAEFSFLRLREKSALTRMYFVSTVTCEESHTFPAQFNFLSIGRCIEQKGHHDAIGFFRALRPQLNGTSSLSIIGEGPTRDTLEALAGSDPDIHFLGSVPRIGRYLNGCTAVLKFALGEGENSVVREAALAGRPVFTTLETANCNVLARQGLIIAVARDITPRGSRSAAETVTNFGSEESAALRRKAEEVWGEEAIKAAWATYPT